MERLEFVLLCLCCLAQETRSFGLRGTHGVGYSMIGSKGVSRMVASSCRTPNSPCQLFMSENGFARKIWKIERPGNLQQLNMIDDILPPPGSGEISVRVESIGLNFADVFTVLGMYDAAPRDKPVIPGLEFCGIVEAIGDRKIFPKAKVARSQDGSRNTVVERADDAPVAPAAGLRVGDRVMGVTRFGALATRLNVAAHFVRRVPDGWSPEQGAGFVVQALTAWYGAVELGAAAAGKLVLVHSAAGGVGLHALQICEHMGMRAVGVVGSESKAALLQELHGLGPDQIIIRTPSAPRFREDLLRTAAAAGRPDGFDMILDSAGGRHFAPGFDSLAAGDRHVLFGAAAYTPRGDVGLSWLSWEFWTRTVPEFLSRPRLDAQKMIGQNRAVLGFNLIWLTDGRSDPGRLGKLMDDTLHPSVPWRPPLVGRVFPFDQAPDALRYFKTGQSVGKVVLSVPGPDSDPAAAAVTDSEPRPE